MDTIKAISVDDEQMNLIIIEEMSRQVGIDVHSFDDSLKASEFIENNNIDIAFIDYSMPRMDGIELISSIRNFHDDIPIIMITGMAGDHKLKLSALEAGATEFLEKPIEAADFIARVQNLVNLRKSQLLLKDKTRYLENEVIRATEAIFEREIETLAILGKAAEYKDPETANHILRVAHYSKLIAEGLGLYEEEQDLILQASKLHDVGKIGINDSILLKPSSLTAKEFKIIMTHCKKGYEILRDSRSKYLQCGALIALSHHEKYDGSGYPNQIKGNDINFYGRIVAVADVFDALTTRRPYKEPWTIDDAYIHLKKKCNIDFDGDIIDSFLAQSDKTFTIYTTFLDKE